MITVLADRHIGNLIEFLHPRINCITFNPEMGPEDEQLQTADALLIRTVTKIDQNLLSKSPKLTFVGTATAGADHVNQELLAAHGINFTPAPGCNARAVAEYTATAILLWSQSNGRPLSGLTAGIVGVGNTGSQVQYLLEKIGLKTWGYDPPREKRDPSFQSCTIGNILEADIITLHIPLLAEGEEATKNWLDEEKISGSKAKLFINAARGGIADEKALLKAQKERNTDFVLDVWKNEPIFDDISANAAFIKTPHIAGYSRQAKRRAMLMVCQALHKHFELPLSDPPQPFAGDEAILTDKNDDFSALVNELHPMRHYDNEFRLLMGLSAEEKKIQFGRLRTLIPLRNEFSNIFLHERILEKFPILRALGIKPNP